MIHAKLDHCTSLQQFYDEIVRAQTTAHGADYCNHHTAISTASFSHLGKRRTIYRELGVNQGATAACAALAGADLQLVDINLDNFRPYLPLFNQFAQYNERGAGMKITLHECSSLDPRTVEYCDVLFIDSVHTAEHVAKEIAMHAASVGHWIIIHDTGTFPEIHERAVKELMWPGSRWGKVLRFTEGAGHSVFLSDPR